MKPLVRPMALPDLDAVLDIQRACYGEGFLEGADVINRRITSRVGLSCVAEREGRVCAYLAAYRTQPGKLTPLHGDFEATSEPSSWPDTLYLHDLAVDPEARGSGAADALVQAFLSALARLPLPRASLIAIQGSAPWWARHGFARVPVDGALGARLAGYGEDAAYMVRLTG